MILFSTHIHKDNNKTLADNLYKDSVEVLNTIEENETKYDKGKTTYFENKNLEKYDSFKMLIYYIFNESKKYLKFLEAKEFDMKITDIWISEINKGGSHPLHVHQGSILSGTFYVHVPKNSGQLSFQRHEWMSDPFQQLEFTRYNDLNSSTMRLSPQKGDLYIWKSDLPHLVEKNNSDSRIAVSFNIGF